MQVKFVATTSTMIKNANKKNDDMSCDKLCNNDTYDIHSSMSQLHVLLSSCFYYNFWQAIRSL